MIKVIDNKVKKKITIHNQLKELPENADNIRTNKIKKELIEKIYNKIDNITKQAFIISEIANEFDIYKDYLPDELAILKYRLALVEKDLEKQKESLSGALKGADPELYQRVTKKLKLLE